MESFVIVCLAVILGMFLRACLAGGSGSRHIPAATNGVAAGSASTLGGNADVIYTTRGESAVEEKPVA